MNSSMLNGRVIAACFLLFFIFMELMSSFDEPTAPPGPTTVPPEPTTTKKPKLISARLALEQLVDRLKLLGNKTISIPADSNFVHIKDVRYLKWTEGSMLGAETFRSNPDGDTKLNFEDKDIIFSFMLTLGPLVIQRGQTFNFSQLRSIRYIYYGAYQAFNMTVKAVNKVIPGTTNYITSLEMFDTKISPMMNITRRRFYQNVWRVHQGDEQDYARWKASAEGVINGTLSKWLQNVLVKAIQNINLLSIF